MKELVNKTIIQWDIHMVLVYTHNTVRAHRFKSLDELFEKLAKISESNDLLLKQESSTQTK